MQLFSKLRKIFKIFQLLALVLISLLFANCGANKLTSQEISAKLAAREAPHRSAECQNFISHLPRNVTAGAYWVPLDWDHPSGEEILIYFYQYSIPESISEGKKPVVFFNGGPGVSAQSSVQLLANSQNLGKNRVIFLDQRGTGCSSSFPDDLDPSILSHKIKQFGVRSIVRDAEALRELIFGKSWSVAGHSFGSSIVMDYIHYAPDHVDSAYIYGNSVSNDPVAWSLGRIQSQERITQAYYDRYPDDKNLILKLKSMILDDDCFEDAHKKFRLCGGSLFDAAGLYLGFTDQWETFHNNLNKLRVSAFLPRQLILPTLKSQIFDQIDSQFNLPAYLLGNMTSGQDTKEICTKAYKLFKDSRAKNQEYLDSLLIDCRFLSELSIKGHEVIKKINFPNPNFIEHLQHELSKGNISLKIFTGKLDSLTSKESLMPLKNSLRPFSRNVTFFELEGGHEGYYVNKEFWDQIFQNSALYPSSHTNDI